MPSVDDEPEPFPITQINLTRQAAAEIDWEGGDLVDLLVASRTNPDVRVVVNRDLRQSAPYVAADAAARTKAGLPPQSTTVDDSWLIQSATAAATAVVLLLRIVTAGYPHVGHRTPGMALVATANSSGLPKGSRSPETNRHGTRRSGKCSVRRFSCLPGGCNG